MNIKQTCCLFISYCLVGGGGWWVGYNQMAAKNQDLADAKLELEITLSEAKAEAEALSIINNAMSTYNNTYLDMYRSRYPELYEKYLD